MKNSIRIQKILRNDPSNRALALIIFLNLFSFQNLLWAGIIKTGMTLSIVVKDDEALTRVVKVKEDGTIDYPLYQDISIHGKTTGELQDLLTFKLAKWVESPLVLVSELDAPIQISVLGQVQKPGMINVSEGASLQEVLLASGGPTDQANLSRIKIMPSGNHEMDAEYYDLEHFLETGDLGTMPEIKNGDKVIVLSTKKSKLVKVLGAVNKPGFYPLKGNGSVFDLIYLAGGPSQDANLSRIRLLVQQENSDLDYLIDLQTYIDEGRTEEIPDVNPGDIIIVYRKLITWSKSLQAVRDIVTIVTAWFVITQAFN